ncbi:MAG: hypothetical protein RsTaC01_0686 [Candidatus Paraimprobicoccus trichonymphae]|uniref:Uncharacterized protein n=1 Tax=Candidatus Paraimprobicoccus trichonymphae TaxID=3033793 RepID=A0AA48KZD9_9FIRM|nr:MAG: hypothetical protein RsTaC01_0686 [Candidatus Paraimprobicoccus trichonymphae]
MFAIKIDIIDYKNIKRIKFSELKLGKNIQGDEIIKKLLRTLYKCKFCQHIIHKKLNANTRLLKNGVLKDLPWDKQIEGTIFAQILTVLYNLTGIAGNVAGAIGRDFLF